jgi:protein neuralized
LNSNQKNEESLLDTPECCICFELAPNTAVYDCGHLCLCYDCAKRQKKVFGKCPICNKQILDIIRIFKV